MRSAFYLALWFGSKEKVAGVKNPGITSAKELKEKIEAAMPVELKNFIDVYVLDVSREWRSATAVRF